MDLTDIKRKAEEYFECTDEKPAMVTYLSAMVFAWNIHLDAVEELRNKIADLIWDERGHCVTDKAARALAEKVRGYN